MAGLLLQNLIFVMITVMNCPSHSNNKCSPGGRLVKQMFLQSRHNKIPLNFGFFSFQKLRIKSRPCSTIERLQFSGFWDTNWEASSNIRETHSKCILPKFFFHLLSGSFHSYRSQCLQGNVLYSCIHLACR